MKWGGRFCLRAGPTRRPRGPYIVKYALPVNGVRQAFKKASKEAIKQTCDIVATAYTVFFYLNHKIGWKGPTSSTGVS